MKKITTLSVTFDLPLFPRQIPQFRGAINELAGLDKDLFHNHRESNLLHYRYPLIQYRIKDKKAAIWALQEGVDPLRSVLLSSGGTFIMNNKKQALKIMRLEERDYILRFTSKPKQYKLFNWLALNHENYIKWLDCVDMKARVELLEKILSNHLMAFVMSIDWKLPERLEVSLQFIQQVKQVKCHNVSMLSFNVAYTTNVVLPPDIAIGKAVSHGFGWQQPVNRKKKAISIQQVPFMESTGDL